MRIFALLAVLTVTTLLSNSPATAQERPMAYQYIVNDTTAPGPWWAVTTIDSTGTPSYCFGVDAEGKHWAKAPSVTGGSKCMATIELDSSRFSAAHVDGVMTLKSNESLTVTIVEGSTEKVAARMQLKSGESREIILPSNDRKGYVVIAETTETLVGFERIASSFYSPAVGLDMYSR